MSKLHSRSWSWQFAAPPERIWPLLADTARFNEAAKLPRHEIEERPQPDGSVLYFGRARMGPFRLAWRERPVNWVANQWFEHVREFESGPLRRLVARFRLTPEAAGCRGDYTLEASAANLAGEIVLRAGFFESAGRSFATMAETAGRCALGERPTPFDYEAPVPTPELRARVEEMVARIEASGHGHGLAARLAEHLLSAQEVDLSRIRPLRLARLWGAVPREAIELCLEATRAGLLELHWDLLCPRCRVAKAVVGALDQVPKGAHCGTCNIDYDRDFSKNVELSFRPAPAVRPIGFGEYCLFGPMSTPHIVLHLTLDAGESRSVAAALPPGLYRLRSLEPGPALDLDVTADGFPELIAEPAAMVAGPLAAPGEVRLSNRTERALTLVVEERHWVRDALTADRASSLQAFRDLFSDQVLRPGDEVAVGRVAIMFTDLSGSTALYTRIGDAPAYHLVRDHYAFLTAIVRQHNGAVIKTIGDAIMAAFAEPGDAAKAALAVQREVAGFNAGHSETPLAIKLGLHEGACIAVTLNDRLDYFGSAVNLAARLQDESRGGDIVISGTMAAGAAVAPLLEGLEAVPEEAALQGFDQPIRFLRVRA